MVTSLSLAQQQRVLSLLDAGCSGEDIAKQTGVSPSTISRLRSKKHSALPKSLGGCPTKLSTTNICHAQHLICTRKAENAVQVTKALTNIINQPLSANTVHLHLKKSGMKAVVKSKRPLLSAKHRKAHLDFAEAHKDWTICYDSPLFFSFLGLIFSFLAITHPSHVIGPLTTLVFVIASFHLFP